MVMASFENTFWTYAIFTAPVKQRPVWGLYHAGEHRALMKDFVSFTAAPLLPFLNTNKSNALMLSICSVIKLYRFLAALSDPHSHTERHASFWQSSVTAVISQHHRGIYFRNERNGGERWSIGECQVFLDTDL